MTDELGTYCTVVLDPETAADLFSGVGSDPIDEAQLASLDFTMEDAEQAWDASVEYVVTVGMDSTRLDNYSIPDEQWFQEAAPLDLFFENGARYEPFDGLVAEGVALTDYLPEPIVRDGNPRLASLIIERGAVSGLTLQSDQSNALGVNTRVTATYRATDADIVEYVLANDSSLTTELLQQEAPQLFDGTDDGLTFTGAYLTVHRAGNIALISGTTFDFLVTAGDFEVGRTD